MPPTERERSTHDPAVRLLTPTDLTAAFSLSEAAGWNQRLDDWQMLLRLAPAGSFAAIADSRIVGTAIGVNYGTFGWIAMMLVDPTWRGRGLGGHLLEAAMAALPPSLPIRLDATPLGRPLYERYGFTDEQGLTRYVRDASTRIEQDAASDRVRPLSIDDLEIIASQDRTVFRGTRRMVLEWMRDNAAGYAQAIADRIGYCFGRRGRLFDQIGPVVAEHEADARALVSAALAAAEDRSVAIDAFDASPAFAEWLMTRGFHVQRPLYRMRRGAALPTEPGPLAELAILGPEFA